MPDEDGDDGGDGGLEWGGPSSIPGATVTELTNPACVCGELPDALVGAFIGLSAGGGSAHVRTRIGRPAMKAATSSTASRKKMAYVFSVT